MNVFSAFNGIGCGFVALERAGIKVNKYYSAEIDQRAIKVNDKNWPRTIQFGDITKIRGEHLMSPIDLLMGGSPCQSLSALGNDKGLSGKSKLFYEFVRIKEEINPKFFFIENVIPKRTIWRDEMSKILGVDAIEVNSNIFIPQSRPRLYWCNWDVKNLRPTNTETLQTLQTLLEFWPEEKYNMSVSWLNWWHKNKDFQLKKSYSSLDRIEALCLTARMYASWNGNFVSRPKTGVIRRLTPIECERLQGLPDNYTDSINEPSRYKALGNGWQVDTIVEFFKHLPDEYKITPLS